MRVHPLGVRSGVRLAVRCALVAALCGWVAGFVFWCWSEAAALIALHGTFALSLPDAGRAQWRLLSSGGWQHPAAAFPRASERAAGAPAGAYLLVAAVTLALAGRATLALAHRISALRARSPLANRRRGLAARAISGGWVGQRTWATPRDLRRLWVPQPLSGRPYLGRCGRRMLAAEPEVQPMVIAPPRAGKSSGFVIPWLLDHDGPVLVLSTKRDVHDASLSRRERLGQVWVYDPFGAPQSAAFTPLVPAATWTGAIRAGAALASAAHPDQANAANEFWDKEAASMLAPLLHACVLCGYEIGELVRWLDSRDFAEAVTALKRAGAAAAADQLAGINRRDERNRETTVMSALNLLRAYRYPQLARASGPPLDAERFLDGAANTLYVVAAGHDQELLRPVILALLASVYETAVTRARRAGPLCPRLLILMDEAANIAPVRNLGSWLSQCGDHGVVIATIWQSIAQIDHRYGRAARDAICAASSAQVFIPPLADPTTSGYLAELLGEEPVANAAGSGGRETLAVSHERVGRAPWLRQVPRGQAILIYRDLPPAVVRAPGWFEDPRFRPASTRWPRTGVHGLTR